MPYEMIIDLVLAFLLAACVGYSLLLSQRLAACRERHDAMLALVISFQDNIARAEEVLANLKKAGEQADHTLCQRMEQAQALRDDLAFMIDRASTIERQVKPLSGFRESIQK